MFNAMGYGVYFFFASSSFLAFFVTFFSSPRPVVFLWKRSSICSSASLFGTPNKILKAELKEKEEQFCFDVKDGAVHQKNREQDEES